MVELEPLEQEEDLNILRTLVEGHWHYTGSTPAKLVLDNWNEMTQRFVKVMPKEFKRVLRQAAKETAGAVA
jgi:glutamate synthase domain-containing protein 3